jgi:hypothetical protein
MTKREAKIKPFEDKLARKELEVQTKDIEVKGKETELKRRERELEAKGASLEDRKAALEASSELLTAKEAKVKEREARVAELEKGLTVRPAECRLFGIDGSALSTDTARLDEGSEGGSQKCDAGRKEGWSRVSIPKSIPSLSLVYPCRICKYLPMFHRG